MLLSLNGVGWSNLKAFWLPFRSTHMDVRKKRQRLKEGDTSTGPCIGPDFSECLDAEACRSGRLCGEVTKSVTRFMHFDFKRRRRLELESANETQDNP